jgi:hypothetical protein
MHAGDPGTGWPALLARGGALIGMVHAGALPGTPRSRLGVAELIASARRDALALREAGFDAVIVENMHDVPYVHGERLGPEIVAAMAMITAEVVAAFGRQVGVQILSGGNRHALAVAHCAGAGFVRCENFVYAHVADEGLLPEAEAGPLLRYRRSIGADGVGVFCDIKKKHASHALTADVPIEGAAASAEFFGADALIVTGVATGSPVDIAELARVRGSTRLPVLVGSGVTPGSVAAVLEHASGAIVGSSIKVGGVWSGPVDPAAATAIVSARDRWSGPGRGASARP